MNKAFRMKIKKTLSFLCAFMIIFSSTSVLVEAVKINKAEHVQLYDEMKRKEIGVGVEAGMYNLAGTQLKGLQYAGLMGIQDRILWEESIKELMEDIRLKTNLDMSLLENVEFTISPYKFNGLAGVTHSTKNRHNVILSQDIKGIPDREYRKEVMKETIAHEIGHVIYNQVDIEETYRMMVGNGGRRTQTNNLNLSPEQWAHHIEENFAEDVKVYIINNIREKSEQPTQRVAKNNTRFSANNRDMGRLMQRSVSSPRAVVTAPRRTRTNQINVGGQAPQRRPIQRQTVERDTREPINPENRAPLRTMDKAPVRTGIDGTVRR